MIPALGCDDFYETAPQGSPWRCCTSCHEDIEYGYDLPCVMPPYRKERSPFAGKVAAVCCRVAEALSKEPLAFWVAARKRQRARHPKTREAFNSSAPAADAPARAVGGLAAGVEGSE